MRALATLMSTFIAAIAACSSHTTYTYGACPTLPDLRCSSNTKPIDTNGDGCLDACGPKRCPEIGILCVHGATAIDSNFDGCVDRCIYPTSACADASFISCPSGQKPFDSNHDGCADSCADEKACDNELLGSCVAGFTPSYRDDGCVGVCVKYTCQSADPDGQHYCADDGGTLADLDGDGTCDVCVRKTSNRN